MRGEEKTPLLKEKAHGKEDVHHAGVSVISLSGACRVLGFTLASCSAGSNFS